MATQAPSDKKNRVYLVDGSGYIFRAFFAIQHLTTREGFPTNALFGFCRMFEKLLHDTGAEHIVVVFDTAEPTFRDELYDQYKANRAECPDELEPQFPFFREIAKALGLPILELAGYEADDVIATLSDRLHADGQEVVIVSGDKDLMQLVDDEGQVLIWDTMRDKWIGRDEVIEKFGVPPDKVVEVLALMGDTSDNVPGLPGVGPKTAAQLIQKFGSVSELLARRNEVSDEATIRNRKKIAEQLESSADILRLSRRLVEVERKAPVTLPQGGAMTGVSELDKEALLTALERRAPDAGMLSTLMDRFEFRLFGDVIAGAARVGADADRWSVRTILKADLKKFLSELEAVEAFALDLETTSLDVAVAEVVGVSFAWGETIAYIPCAHREGEGVRDQVSWEELSDALRPILESEATRKIAHNLKYDLGVLAERGIHLRGELFDTMVAGYLLRPDRRGNDLGVLSAEYLQESVVDYDEVLGGQVDLRFVAIERVAQYAGQDAALTWRLYEKFHPLLKEADLLKVFHEIEMPLVPILSAMERVGMLIDTEALARMSEELDVELQQIQTQVFEAAGCEFNLNSPKQLSEVLFEKLGLPTKGLRKTKTGISTDSTTLEKLEDLHLVPRLLLRHRVLFKLKSTYMDALPAQVSARDGRLHSSFHQTVTGTGRLSSSEPNLQNIPIQTSEGVRVREAFIAPTGRVLISADYSQIELRVLAHMAKDARLCEAFRRGEDIHTTTARELLHLPSGAVVTPEQRRLGKTMNFGVIYGMGPYRLSRELEIPLSEAQQYIANYFGRFSGVDAYLRQQEKAAEGRGFVETIFGRKRFLADLDTTGRDDQFVARVAMNAPVQGSAADIIKLAMIRIVESIEREALPLTLILQVHDELVFECDAAQEGAMAERIKREMEQVVQLDVPLIVDVGSGSNWRVAHG